jgi:hypothetical protein
MWIWVRGTLAGFGLWTSISIVASAIDVAAKRGGIGVASICSLVGASVMYCAWFAAITSLRRPTTRYKEHALYIGGLLVLTWFQQPIGVCILYVSTTPIESLIDAALVFLVIIAFATYLLAVAYIVAYIVAPRMLEQRPTHAPKTVWILVEQPDETLFIARTPEICII